MNEEDWPNEDWPDDDSANEAACRLVIDAEEAALALQHARVSEMHDSHTQSQSIDGDSQEVFRPLVHSATKRPRRVMSDSSSDEDEDKCKSSTPRKAKLSLSHRFQHKSISRSDSEDAINNEGKREETNSSKTRYNGKDSESVLLSCDVNRATVGARPLEDLPVEISGNFSKISADNVVMIAGLDEANEVNCETPPSASVAADDDSQVVNFRRPGRRRLEFIGASSSEEEVEDSQEVTRPRVTSTMRCPHRVMSDSSSEQDDNSFTPGNPFSTAKLCRSSERIAKRRRRTFRMSTTKEVLDNIDYSPYKSHRHLQPLRPNELMRATNRYNCDYDSSDGSSIEDFLDDQKTSSQEVDVCSYHRQNEQFRHESTSSSDITEDTQEQISSSETRYDPQTGTEQNDSESACLGGDSQQGKVNKDPAVDPNGSLSLSSVRTDNTELVGGSNEAKERNVEAPPSADVAEDDDSQVVNFRRPGRRRLEFVDASSSEEEVEDSQEVTRPRVTSATKRPRRVTSDVSASDEEVGGDDGRTSPKTSSRVVLMAGKREDRLRLLNVLKTKRIVISPLLPLYETGHFF